MTDSNRYAFTRQALALRSIPEKFWEPRHLAAYQRLAQGSSQDPDEDIRCLFSLINKYIAIEEAKMKSAKPARWWAGIPDLFKEATEHFLTH